MENPRPPATLADVAERAGVSRQTVSNAINNPDLLRPETLVRVQDAIDALGYTPNHAARHLRTRSSRLVGLRLTPAQEFTANMAMDRFVRALVEAAREVGYHVLLFSGGPVAEGDVPDPLGGYDDLLRSTAVDAFVVTDTYLGNPQTVELARRRAPFVAFGRPWDDPDATHPWVDVDGSSGVAAATTHVRGQGHERIAWLGWEPGSRIGEDRRAGWFRAMAAHGLPTAGLEAAVADSVDAGRAAAGVLLDNGATAFVCASDTLAVGALHALGDRGIAPGRDVAVVGFDDSQVAQVMGLTSVRQPLEQVAVELVGALTDLLSAAEHPDAEVLLTPSLEVRRSSTRG
ncbi:MULTISPECIES: LacI family DNA-binding transcriptional regulator [unclassified Nocardioides]|uniref:LacI family DNA-binding transcriptional regulator n=1 Tax=unclassified Nocardioides TaxID=2615069 RepID=UPI0007023FBE|nr:MULTISPECIES: substrate-binding domain-containing protein [unclassified Nocardioides]KRC52805.1 LacI family transcriptional regulator [Nocardioides sp. Root79]KRC72336.1 LacI family transcriptional regulator [Nocardioides sp. Root240]